MTLDLTQKSPLNSDELLELFEKNNFTMQGLQNPSQVSAFLSTATGKAVTAEIIKEFSEKKLQQEQTAEEQARRDILADKFKAMIFMLLAGKESRASHMLQDYIEKQNHEAIVHAQIATTPKTSASSNQLDALYDELETINLNTQQALNTYEQSQQGILKAQAFLKDQVNDNQKNQAAIQQEQQKLEKRYQADMQKLDDPRLSEADLIELQNSMLQTKMQIAAYQEMQLVLEGSRYYADENGYKVADLKKAKITLAKDERVVKGVGGNKYILNNNENNADLSNKNFADKASRRFADALLLSDATALNQMIQLSEANKQHTIISHRITAVKNAHSPTIEMTAPPPSFCSTLLIEQEFIALDAYNRKQENAIKPTHPNDFSYSVKQLTMA